MARGLRKYSSSATSASCDAVSAIQGSTLGLGELIAVRNGAFRVVAGSHFCVDFDTRVGGHELIRDGHALDDLNAGAHDSVVLHDAHRDEAVDLRDAEPVEHVGHELL